MLRIGLFLLTNLAIMLVASLAINILGLQSFQGTQINYVQTLIICGIIGCTGSFISLILSKWIALKTTGAQIITTPRNETERVLFSTVQELARKAKIGVPDIAIYSSTDVNAFATGMNKNHALIAVSSEMLNKMNDTEIKAVLGHEMAHIANGDMVTLTLIQGIVNTFVMFLARIVGNIVDRTLLGNKEGHGIGYMVSVFVCELVFGLLASCIVMAFSRWREYRADKGSAMLYNKEAMIEALKRLQTIHEPTETPKEIAAFGISGRTSRWGALWMSHPSLEDRILALQKLP